MNLKTLYFLFFLTLIFSVPAGIFWNFSEPMIGLTTLIFSFGTLIQTRKEKPKVIGVLLQDAQESSILIPWMVDQLIPPSIFWKPRLTAWLQRQEEPFGLMSNDKIKKDFPYSHGQAFLKLSEFVESNEYIPFSEDKNFQYLVTIVTWEGVFPENINSTKKGETLLWEGFKTPTVCIPHNKKKE